MSDRYHAEFTWGAGPQSVYVAGGFNDWSPTASPLHRKEDGSFSTLIPVPYGEKQAYKYIVDGDWMVREDEAKEWDAAGNHNNIYTAPAQSSGQTTGSTKTQDLLASSAPTMIGGSTAASIPSSTGPALSGTATGETEEDRNLSKKEKERVRKAKQKAAKKRAAGLNDDDPTPPSSGAVTPTAELAGSEHPFNQSHSSSAFAGAPMAAAAGGAGALGTSQFAHHGEHGSDRGQDRTFNCSTGLEPVGVKETVVTAEETPAGTLTQVEETTIIDHAALDRQTANQTTQDEPADASQTLGGKAAALGGAAIGAVAGGLGAAALAVKNVTGVDMTLSKEAQDAAPKDTLVGSTEPDVRTDVPAPTGAGAAVGPDVRSDLAAPAIAGSHLRSGAAPAVGADVRSDALAPGIAGADVRSEITPSNASTAPIAPKTTNAHDSYPSPAVPAAAAPADATSFAASDDAIPGIAQIGTAEEQAAQVKAAQGEDQGITGKAAAMGGAAAGAVVGGLGAAVLAVKNATGLNVAPDAEPISVEDARARGIDVSSIPKVDGPTDALGAPPTAPPEVAVNQLQEIVAGLKHDDAAAAERIAAPAGIAGGVVMLNKDIHPSTGNQTTGAHHEDGVPGNNAPAAVGTTDHRGADPNMNIADSTLGSSGHAGGQAYQGKTSTVMTEGGQKAIDGPSPTYGAPGLDKGIAPEGEVSMSREGPKKADLPSQEEAAKINNSKVPAPRITPVGSPTHGPASPASSRGPGSPLRPTQSRASGRGGNSIDASRSGAGAVAAEALGNNDRAGSTTSGNNALASPAGAASGFAATSVPAADVAASVDNTGNIVSKQGEYVGSTVDASGRSIGEVARENLAAGGGAETPVGHKSAAAVTHPSSMGTGVDHAEDSRPHATAGLAATGAAIGAAAGLGAAGHHRSLDATSGAAEHPGSRVSNRDTPIYGVAAPSAGRNEAVSTGGAADALAAGTGHPSAVDDRLANAGRNETKPNIPASGVTGTSPSVNYSSGTPVIATATPHAIASSADKHTTGSTHGVSHTAHSGTETGASSIKPVIVPAVVPKQPVDTGLSQGQSTTHGLSSLSSTGPADKRDVDGRLYDAPPAVHTAMDRGETAPVTAATTAGPTSISHAEVGKPGVTEDHSSHTAGLASAGLLGAGAAGAAGAAHHANGSKTDNDASKTSALTTPETPGKKERRRSSVFGSIFKKKDRDSLAVTDAPPVPPLPKDSTTPAGTLSKQSGSAYKDDIAAPGATTTGLGAASTGAAAAAAADGSRTDTSVGVPKSTGGETLGAYQQSTPGATHTTGALGATTGASHPSTTGATGASHPSTTGATTGATHTTPTGALAGTGIGAPKTTGDETLGSYQHSTPGATGAITGLSHPSTTNGASATHATGTHPSTGRDDSAAGFAENAMNRATGFGRDGTTTPTGAPSHGATLGKTSVADEHKTVPDHIGHAKSSSLSAPGSKLAVPQDAHATSASAPATPAKDAHVKKSKSGFFAKLKQAFSSKH